MAWEGEGVEVGVPAPCEETLLIRSGPTVGTLASLLGLFRNMPSSARPWRSMVDKLDGAPTQRGTDEGLSCSERVGMEAE